MTTVVNEILQDALGNPRDRVKEPSAAYSSATVQQNPSGKVGRVRASIVVKCPFCESKYKVEEGEFLEFILKNGKRKKLQVCMNCYQKAQ